jgi:hypothetical protein
MQRVRLLHWNRAEAGERAQQLQSAGFDIIYEPLDAAGLRALRQDPPSAVVIDLGRAPSQGRDVALGLRKYKATRNVPLVFVGGEPNKVARLKELLPDAVYATWDDVGRSLERAIAHPPAEPVVPESVFAAYARTPLPKKLGIKANSVVALVGAPERFEGTLGELPEGASLHQGVCERCDLTLWFVSARKDLEARIEKMGTWAREGGLWILWPKKSSGVVSDLSQTAVREVGLASGLVDFKVCAVDATWSGLRFTQRKGE